MVPTRTCTRARMHTHAHTHQMRARAHSPTQTQRTLMQTHLQSLVALRRSMLQQAIECEINNRARLVADRRREGVASSETRAIDRQVKSCEERVRTLCGTWTAWGQLLAESGAGSSMLAEGGVDARLVAMGRGAAAPNSPELALELEEDAVLQGVYPWDASTARNLETPQALALQLHKVRAEMQRCKEELEYLPADARQVMQYYSCQLSYVASRLLDTCPGCADAYLLHSKFQQLWRRQRTARLAFDNIKWL